MIKKILILLVIVLNLMLPLNIFAEEVTEPIQELEKGQGTVKELVKDGTREFFTITTQNGATFYLVVDKDKSSDNVYFLKTVNEIDLIELAGQNAVIYESTETTTKEPTTESTTEEIIVEEEQEENNSSFGFIEIVALIGFIGLMGYLIYNKFKGKTKNNSFDEDDDIDEDEEEQEEKSNSSVQPIQNDENVITGLINKDIQ